MASESTEAYSRDTDKFEFLTISGSSSSDSSSTNLFLNPGEVIAPVQEAHKPGVSVHLPPFWPAHPAAWFGAPEAAFSLKNVTQVQDKFSYSIAMLGEDLLIQIATSWKPFPLPPNAFTSLKHRLVQTHILDELQSVEMLLDLSPTAASTLQSC